MAGVPLGANVGTAWVALRFSAQGSKKDIQKQIDAQTSGVGEASGAKVGKDFSDSFSKNTDVGKSTGERIGRDLTSSFGKETSGIGAKLKSIFNSSNGSSGGLFKSISTDAEAAGTSITGLGGNMGKLSNYGMPALIGSIAALSPVIATLGTGFAGLGLAAFGIISPIEKAAKASGGLQANLHKLNPEQQIVAKGILSLQDSFHGFERAVQPEVLGAFSHGLMIAKNLLHDIEPVTVQTGKAFNAFLGAFGKDLQGQQWQQFFTWMAANAGPDMQKLSGAFLSILNSMPTIIEDLQPLANGFLSVATQGSKALGVIGQIGHAVEHPPNNSLLAKINEGINWLDNHVPAGHKSILQLVEGSDSASKSMGAMGGAAKAAASEITPLSPIVTDLGKSWTYTTTKTMNAHVSSLALVKSLSVLGQGSQETGKAVAQTGPNFVALSRATDKVGKSFSNVGLVKSMNSFAGNTRVAAKEAAVLAQNSPPLVTTITNLGKKFASLATNELAALTPLETYANNAITAKTDLVNLQAALKGSHDKVGLNTAAQRSSFTTAQQYITFLQQQASSAIKSGKGAKSAATDIANGLPTLSKAAASNKALRKEVDLLRQALENLRKEKAIHNTVTVTGSGNWSFSKTQGVSGTRTGPGGLPTAASGMFVNSGTGPTADDVLARVSRGELIVPAKYVSAGMVDNLRGMIPGFNTGGLVGNYSGNVGGLASWTKKDWNATVADITASIAHAMTQQAKTAASSGSPGFGIAPKGPLQKYAQKLLAAYGWGNQWGYFNDVVMRESGWRVNAANPSGAYGIPQALPASKMASAGADWLTNGFTQLRWMMGYIKSTYGDPAGAWNSELTRGFYDNGGLANGIGMMPKHTIKPERVLSPKQTSAFERLVSMLDGRSGGSAEPRKMVITGGKVTLDNNGNLVIRHLAAEEARAEIAFAQRGR